MQFLLWNSKTKGLSALLRGNSVVVAEGEERVGQLLFSAKIPPAGKGSNRDTVHS